LRDIKAACTKGVTRLHERWGRGLNKSRGDERGKRLEALKANDIEAYQELLKQQQVSMHEASSNRSACTKLLKQQQVSMHE
jgi:SWI/SNF-related matrix-associated actin-dependent regulator of chromatin subfamily A member 2/4